MKTITKNIIVYQSKDGKEFDNQEDCKNHEKALYQSQILAALWGCDTAGSKEYNDELIVYLFERGYISIKPEAYKDIKRLKLII
jgi:hypothetical protein